jgi:hypothetical protein
MKSFAEAWSRSPILQPPVAKLEPLVTQIPWAHHIVLLNKTKAGKERLFYLKKSGY